MALAVMSMLCLIWLSLAVGLISAEERQAIKMKGML